jgi:hypothetical protein
MNILRDGLSHIWYRIQGSLLPWLEEEVGPLTEKHRLVVTILDVVRIEDYIPFYYQLDPGRPPADRQALARAFVAKAALNLPTTVMLIDRLNSDSCLRRICGWEKRQEIPDASTFSRVFAEFARNRLPERVHAALVTRDSEEPLVGHISRDSTQIDAREKPVFGGPAIDCSNKKAASLPDGKVLPGLEAEPVPVLPEQTEHVLTPKPEEILEKPKPKRGRPRKADSTLKTLSHLERQGNMTLGEMLNDLPKQCDVGTKLNSKGHKESWIGYKLHLDTADGGIPISCILTSASLHDSQVSIPLATMTAQRVTYLYELMDSAYDAGIIKEHSLLHGHVPIIDINTRNNTKLRDELAAEGKARKTINMTFPEDVRYNGRTASERANGRLKDEFGGKMVRVRGHAKIMCHLMFGVLALTADQLMKMVT